MKDASRKGESCFPSTPMTAPRKNKGKDILKHTGAEDIGVKGESGADYDISDRPYVKGSKDAPTD